MSHGAPPDGFEPQWFLVVFLGVWLAVSTILSRVSGWSRLAEQFRSELPASGDSFRFVSGTMGSKLFPANFNSCLSVSLSPAGLRLSIQFPFRLMNPPLFIPWTAVESVEQSRRFLRLGTALRLRDQWPVITLYGRAGQALAEACPAKSALVTR